MKPDVSRRRFLGATSGAVAGASMLAPLRAAGSDKPAVLGGQPVRTQPFHSWPVFDQREETALLETLRSGKWGRGTGKKVASFEGQYASLMGAKHCLATASGTAALFTSLNAMGIGAGDEVLVTPYTFVACVNVILQRHALPVFVDIDPETFQIDARKIDAMVTGRTVAIMPVHLGGSTFDVDAVVSAARKHKLMILEDSCQSHLAEWKGRRTGTFGDAGCFSFQASKNLNSGEGGAILTNNAELVEKMYTFHNNGRSRVQEGNDFSYKTEGMNLRLAEFQGALLSAQMSRVEEQSKTRGQNARYLTGMLTELGGLTPVKMHSGTTRNAYHLFMMRYNKERFAGLSRDAFLKALHAEGIPGSGGYSPLNREPFLKITLESRGFQRLYSKERIAQWMNANECPANDQVCQEAVWFTQNMLLGPKTDMDQIVEAVKKIQRNAGQLAKA